MAKEEIIIDVQINVGDTEKKLGEVTGAIYDLKEQNKQLSKQLKEEGADYNELTKQITLNKQEIKGLQSVEKDLIGNLEALTKKRSDYSDTLRGQEKFVRDLEAQYKSLTKAEAESERGQQMKADLLKAKEAVNDVNKSLGNFQSQVGNYAIAGESMNKSIAEMVVEMKKLKDSGNENSKEYQTLVNNVANYESANGSLKATLKEIVVEMAKMSLRGEENTEAFKALAERGGELKDTLSDIQTRLKNVGSDTRGIDQTIAAFTTMGSVAQVAEGSMALFGNESEDVARSIQKLVAIQSILNGVQEVANALQKESAFMLGVVAVKEKALAISKVVITNLTRIFGVTSAQAWAMATLGVSLLVTGIILLISNFNAIIGKVKEFLGISQNFDKVNDSINRNGKALENYGQTTSNVADRLKALGKSDREILDYRRERYNEELKLQLGLYNNIKKKGKEATDEEKKLLEEATNFIKNNASNKYKFETEYIALSRKEQEDAEKKKQDSIKKTTDLTKAEIERRKELIKNAQDASRALEDAQNEAIKDAVDKAVEIEKDSNRRKIEDLKAKLLEDKNLTKQARADINATIEQLEANSEEKIRKIKEDAIRDKLQKDLTAEQNRIQILLDTAQKGSQNELDLRYKAIENLRQQELAGAELTEKDKQLINAKYDKQKEEAEKQAIKRSSDLKKQALDNEFAEMKLKLDEQNASELERSQLELEQAQAQADALISIDSKQKEALYETEEAYNSAVIASKQKVVDASQAVMQSEQKLLELQVSTFQGFGSAISDVLSEVASNSKEALVFQKFIALANSSLNLATAISAATASSVAGDPYTMALRIASNVASVIISFSQVTKAINSANVPTPPKFATGGIVSGTSFTGDKVPALVNSGEMILNQEQQAKLFAMVAGGGMVGGGGIDYQALANAMSKQPAPVLNYAEFTQFQQKIVTFDEITKI